MDDLRGRRVLVTGASTGIGAAVARGFGAAGAVVGVHYNASEAEAAALVARLPADERRRLRAAVLALGRASLRASTPLPEPLAERLLWTALGLP